MRYYERNLHDGSWGVLGNRGAPLSFFRRAHLLTTGPLARRWYCRVASGARSARRIALSAESASQCCRDCGPGHHCLCGGSGTPLPPPAKTCHRQLLRRGRGSHVWPPLLSLLRKRNRKRRMRTNSDIPLGSEGHQQRRGSICLRSICLYELFRHL